MARLNSKLRVQSSDGKPGLDANRIRQIHDEITHWLESQYGEEPLSRIEQREHDRFFKTQHRDIVMKLRHTQPPSQREALGAASDERGGAFNPASGEGTLPPDIRPVSQGGELILQHREHHPEIEGLKKAYDKGNNLVFHLFSEEHAAMAGDFFKDAMAVDANGYEVKKHRVQWRNNKAGWLVNFDLLDTPENPCFIELQNDVNLQSSTDIEASRRWQTETVASLKAHLQSKFPEIELVAEEKSYKDICATHDALDIAMRTGSFLSGLTTKQMETLKSQTPMLVQSDHFLDEGVSEHDCAFVLLKGRLNIYEKNPKTGKDEFIREIGRGAVLGEFGALGKAMGLFNVQKDQTLRFGMVRKKDSAQEVEVLPIPISLIRDMLQNGQLDTAQNAIRAMVTTRKALLEERAASMAETPKSDIAASTIGAHKVPEKISPKHFL